MNQSIPSLTCHHCGYDLHDRQQGDPCPECSTPFDTRPDAYINPWKLNAAITCILIAIVSVPFIAIFSLIFLMPAYFAHSSLKMVSSENRIPTWASNKLRLCYKLMLACLIEFLALMFISDLWPRLFNWW